MSEMKENNQRVRLTKRIFHENLLALMRTQSIEKVSITELCKMCELNRATFYAHYETPEDILREIEDDFIEQAGKYISNIDLGSSHVSRTEAYLKYIKENQTVFRLIIGENGRDAFRQKFFESVLPGGIIAEEKLNVSPELKPFVDGYIVSGSFAIVYTWMLHDFQIPERKLAELINRMSYNAARDYIQGIE